MPSTARGCHELSLLILIFIQTHVNLLHAKMVENANQKMETGGKIEIPQELLDNAKDAEKEEQPE